MGHGITIHLPSTRLHLDVLNLGPAQTSGPFYFSNEDDDFTAPGQHGNEAPQIARPQGDASLRRSEARARYMHEDRAAAVAHARHIVVPEHDHDIIKFVVTP